MEIETNLDFLVEITQQQKFTVSSQAENEQQSLIALARKWARYGCEETPKVTLRMLLGGLRNV